MRGHSGVTFFEPYQLVDMVKSERIYSGDSLMDVLNIITASLHFSCFVNERRLRVFSLLSVGIDRSERMSFAA